MDPHTKPDDRSTPNDTPSMTMTDRHDNATGLAPSTTAQAAACDGSAPRVPDRSTTNDAARSESTAATAGGQPMAHGSGSITRWWLAILAGSVVSVGLAWFLSYAAALPFYLGVFFFLVGGLMIGAVVYRVASPGRPYGRAGVLCGTSIVVLVGWGATIAIEAYNFPDVVARKAQKRTLSIGDRTPEAYRDAVAEGVRNHIRQAYPPGGLVGYVRWVLANKELTKHDVAELKRPMQFPVTGNAWAIRVVLSIGLLGFGIASQTLALRKPGEPTKRA